MLESDFLSDTFNYDSSYDRFPEIFFPYSLLTIKNTLMFRIGLRRKCQGRRPVETCSVYPTICNLT
jgi:hypothetical protein